MMTIDGAKMDRIIYFETTQENYYFKDPVHRKLYMGFGWLNFFIVVAFRIMMTQYGRRLSVLVVTRV